MAEIWYTNTHMYTRYTCIHTYTHTHKRTQTYTHTKFISNMRVLVVGMEWMDFKLMF